MIRNTNLNSRGKNIIEFIRARAKANSSEVYRYLVEKGESASLITIKRELSRLKSDGILTTSGIGRATTYSLTEFGKLTTDVDASIYCAEEPDKRYGADGYNFDLFPTLVFNPFSEAEMAVLSRAFTFYKSRTHNVSQTVHKKELERFVIELSWKSSKIEGNTYTLLDTERLITRGIEAAGHGKEEALMILNHKDAFSYIYENKNKFKNLTLSNLEDIHKLLVKNMKVNFNIRSAPVGVVGSKYHPLDNKYQVNEAVESLFTAVSRMPNGYAKSFIALMGISYIQPFEDGNKRTARLIANALLLAHDLMPLSYRSVDEKKYREAMLVFYELNSLVPAKKIFIEQYEFATKNYLTI